MCGRTGLGLNKENIRCACSYKPKGSDTFKKPKWIDEHNDGRNFAPSYNIAPTDVTPVLTSSQFQGTTCRVLKPMMWGIIPPWHKGDYRSHNLSTNNCRLENIKASKLYGPALKSGGRCIIVVEGFYEWQTTDKMTKKKQPYYIYAPQKDEVKMDTPESWTNEYNDDTGWNGIQLLHMAGVYSMWQQNGKIIYAYSVITMESNSTFDWLHHRMPAVLDTEEQIDAWLDVDLVKTDMALSYLRPVTMLAWHPVSTMVNSSRNKSSDCNKIINLEKKQKAHQKPLTAWFSSSGKRKLNEETSQSAKKTKTTSP